MTPPAMATCKYVRMFPFCRRRNAPPPPVISVQTNLVQLAVTVRDRELIDSTVQLARGIDDLWGVFCCQCRRGRAGSPPRFFEINPRFGGGAPLSIAAGANLPLYVLQEVLGLPITAQVGQFTENILMLRYDEAIFIPVTDPHELPGFDTPSFR